MTELESVLIDVNRQLNKRIKQLTRVIIILIVCFMLYALAGFGIFAWYESQFEETTKETVTTDVSTTGENANLEYNSVEGNQYNDNATHNE